MYSIDPGWPNVVHVSFISNVLFCGGGGSGALLLLRGQKCFFEHDAGQAAKRVRAGVINVVILPGGLLRLGADGLGVDLDAVDHGAVVGVVG